MGTQGWSSHWSKMVTGLTWTKQIKCRRQYEQLKSSGGNKVMQQVTDKYNSTYMNNIRSLPCCINEPFEEGVSLGRLEARLNIDCHMIRIIWNVSALFTREGLFEKNRSQYIICVLCDSQGLFDHFVLGRYLQLLLTAVCRGLWWHWAWHFRYPQFMLPKPWSAHQSRYVHCTPTGTTCCQSMSVNDLCSPVHFHQERNWNRKIHKKLSWSLDFDLCPIQVLHTFHSLSALLIPCWWFFFLKQV